MHPGVRPPVYLAGSFSDPAWHPQEMDFTTEENNEYSFYKDIMVEEGSRSQYKFRIGSGDWWELDENAPTGTSVCGEICVTLPCGSHDHDSFIFYLVIRNVKAPQN